MDDADEYNFADQFPVLSVSLTLYSMDEPFIRWATSVDPDQSAHPWHLIRIYTVRFLVRNNLINLKATSVDPDQTA